MEIAQFLGLIVSTAFTTISGYFLYKIKQYEENVQKKKEAEEKLWGIMQEGFRTLLRDRIMQACRYYIQKGYTNEEALQNVAKMYTLYHEKLKANDVAHKYYDKFMSLPVEGTDYD